MRRKAFISYHHANDQKYKDDLIIFNKIHKIFIDMSVDTGDISDDLTDEQIREKIRDEYLKDATVLILLVGKETKNRKHIDWEIYSSMYNGKINKKSGILIINLPSIRDYSSVRANNTSEKSEVFSEINSWTTINTRKEYEERYPYMPARIIDNFLKENVKISVANWEHATNPEKLKLLIENAFNNKDFNEYDLSKPMRRNNS